MAEISQIKLPNNTILDVKDTVSRTNVPYFVVGTQTTATGSWTGTLTAVSGLYNGLSILYYLPYAGSGNATLTLTLGTGVTAAAPVYYTGTTRATTHYPAGSVILLTYYNEAWRRADYNSDSHYTTHLYAGSGTAANATTTNGNTKITVADNTTARDSITIKGTGATTVTSDNGIITINSTDNNTTYTGANGISLSGTTFSNSGVRSIATGSSNGTISVNTNGTSANVSVKGLGSAAYTDSTAYAAANHTHSYAGSSSAGGAATSANKLNTNAGSALSPVYFSGGVPVEGSGKSIPFITGTGTTAGTWLGSESSISAYTDGLLILYKPSVAGASTTTLNINSLGAKTIYFTGGTKLTTHFAANQPILLVYSTSQNSGCWMCIDSYDANNYVTQTGTTTDATYEILFSGTADNTNRTEGARKTSTLTYNPSTKALSTGGTVNGYTLAAASAKGVVTAVDTTANLPTSGAVKTYVDNAIGALDATLTGSPGAGKTLTVFSETNGKVSATFENISITNAQVSGLGGAATKGVDTSLTTSSTSTNLPTSKAVATLVANATAALTGAMHFKGTTTTSLKDGDTTSPIVINNSNYTPNSGDVVLCDDKEFVWDGTLWELLGDEGSYALKTNTASVVKSVNFTANGLPSLTVTNKNIPNVTAVGTAPSLTITSVSIPNVTNAGSVPSLTITNKSIPNVTGVGTLPSLSTTDKEISYSVENGTLILSTVSFKAFDTWNAGTLPTLGTAISVGSASGWNAGSKPTLGTNITVGSASNWSAGSVPTLGTAISVGSASGWNAGSQASLTTASETVVVP